MGLTRRKLEERRKVSRLEAGARGLGDGIFFSFDDELGLQDRDAKRQAEAAYPGTFFTGQLLGTLAPSALAAIPTGGAAPAAGAARLVTLGARLLPKLARGGASTMPRAALTQGAAGAVQGLGASDTVGTDRSGAYETGMGLAAGAIGGPLGSLIGRVARRVPWRYRNNRAGLPSEEAHEALQDRRPDLIPDEHARLADMSPNTRAALNRQLRGARRGDVRGEYTERINDAASLVERRFPEAAALRRTPPLEPQAMLERAAGVEVGERFASDPRRIAALVKELSPEQRRGAASAVFEELVHKLDEGTLKLNDLERLARDDARKEALELLFPGEAGELLGFLHNRLRTQSTGAALGLSGVMDPMFEPAAKLPISASEVVAAGRIGQEIGRRLTRPVREKQREVLVDTLLKPAQTLRGDLGARLQVPKPTTSGPGPSSILRFLGTDLTGDQTPTYRRPR